ncbi:alpha/beta fold hydrolase [Falsiroseomonas oryziterrae]|uniref:alpha/beta fold hydrolase n=1 Tax=Falsiroseomonas oryziterrae TaxID=2911368 RepID=UPI001F395DAD|nr:alpha/beta hydrolase [Roseomonas sp. NPKOSM-4]
MQDAATLPGRDFEGVPVMPPLDPSWSMRRIRLSTGADIAFTWRAGTGLPLLFLTANRTTRRIFDFVLAEMEPANPVAVPDYRGLGESSGPTVADLDDHLDDLEDLCDALGWDRFAVVGQATGATLALLLATRLPDRVAALAAGDVAVGLRADVFDLFLQQVERHEAGFATRSEALAETPFRAEWSPEVARHWGDTALESTGDGRLRWRYHRDSIVATQRALTEDLWPRIRVAQPALLFHGEHCTVIGQEEMRRARKNIPQARFATLAGANHRLTQDSPAEFSRIVSAFLREEGVLR